jgi:predicted O-linked N-acetylglucosamine transferase (SPINDLY family)
MFEHLIQLFAGGRFEPLKAACTAILSTQPQQALAHHALGLLLAWSGRFEDSATHLRESLRPPHPPSPFLHLAHILHYGLKDTALALAVLEKGVDLNPSALELLEFKRSLGASAPCQVPQDTDARVSPCAASAARGHRLAGRMKEATETLILGLLNSPLDSGLLKEFGLCKQAEGLHAESAGCFRALTRVSPTNADSWCHLGAALLASGNPGQAAPALEAAIRIQPGWHLPHRHLAMAHLQSSQHDAALRSLQRCAGLAPEDTVSLSQLLFSLNYLPTRLQVDLPAAYLSARGRFGPALPRPQLPARLPRRLKIGYVSSDFSQHPVSYFLEPLLEHRDKSAFELFAYSNSPKCDATTARLKSRCDNWVEAWSLPDESLASQIRRDGIHILVDLSGHTPGNRLKVFARRPAPLQITMIGCMQTTGMPFMDLRVTDRFLNPHAKAEHETESLLLMDSGAVAFRPPEGAPAVPPLPCQHGAPFTFASLNDPAKVTEEALSLWAEILLATPESRLLLVQRPGGRLKQALEDLGVSGERIQERGYAPLDAYLRMHGEVDLALDPFPYNGLTVTLMGCWMGVPTVTLAGAAPPARTAADVLTRIGMREFVCDTPDSYVATAVRMFRDPDRLAAVRCGLRDRTRDAWCDGKGYTREFEAKVLDHFQRLIQSREP